MLVERYLQRDPPEFPLRWEAELPRVTDPDDLVAVLDAVLAGRISQQRGMNLLNVSGSTMRRYLERRRNDVRDYDGEHGAE